MLVLPDLPCNINQAKRTPPKLESFGYLGVPTHPISTLASVTLCANCNYSTRGLQVSVQNLRLR